MTTRSITYLISLNKGLNSPMKLNKTILGILSAATLTALASTGAMAQQATFASATGTGPIPAQSTVFTYTGGPNGQFTTTPGALFASASFPASDTSILSFTGFGTSGTATGTGTLADPFKQGLGGGTFSLKSTSGADLLDGNFGGGNLLTAFDSSSSTASITDSVNGVTYTGGSYFANSGLLNPGAFSISMTSVAPTPTITNGYLSAFKAGGTTTFSATVPQPAAVPEAGTIVPFAIGSLGLLALIVRKNRRASGVIA